jgi:hypothetical protein
MEIIEDKVSYTFTASGGEVITLRRMSDRQRTRFFNFTFAAVRQKFQDFIKLVVTEEGGLLTGVTVKEAQPAFDAYREQVYAVVDDLLMEPHDVTVIRSWDHPGDYADLSGLLNTVVEAEVPKQDDVSVPTPDKVDEMSDKEIERLGEPSASKRRRANTSPSSPVTETCSSGAESTADEKPAIFEMSPTPS